MLKDAGLDRINHNLNSSRAYYHNICTTHTFEQRVANIRMLQGLGFEICSGGIIGMGESKEDVVDMLLELREISRRLCQSIFCCRSRAHHLGMQIFPV